MRRNFQSRSEMIRWALREGRRLSGETDISYSQLAQKMEHMGIRDPRNNQFINKSRVASYAGDGGAEPPDWFMEAVRRIVGLPSNWVGSVQLSGESQEADKAVRYNLLPLLPYGESLIGMDTVGWAGESLRVPVVVDGIATRVRTVQALPFISPRDLVVIDRQQKDPQLDRIYAFESKDGQTIVYGKAVERSGELQFLPPKDRPTIDLGAHDLAGLVVAILYDYDETSNSSEGIFNTKGVRFHGW